MKLIIPILSAFAAVGFLAACPGPKMPSGPPPEYEPPPPPSWLHDAGTPEGAAPAPASPDAGVPGV